MQSILLELLCKQQMIQYGHLDNIEPDFEDWKVHELLQGINPDLIAKLY